MTRVSTAEELRSSPELAGPHGPAPASGGRPRMLFLCQTLPFPPDGGVLIRTYNVLRLLARSFDITALCFYRIADKPAPELVAEGVAALGSLARVEAFPISQEHSRVRLAWDHLRSLLQRRAYTHFAYESGAFRRRLHELLRDERFDLVHVDSLDLAAYLPSLAGLPVVCVHHNVESALLRGRARAETRRALRVYFRFQADRLEEEERQWCGRVSLNVTVSEADRSDLSRLAPDARCLVVPNGVDTRSFVPTAGAGEGIVFVGGATWFPNTDGMQYFCDEILPVLRSRGIDAPVRWVGRTSEDLRRQFCERHAVELTGYVPDIRPHVASAACYVVPLRVGGGTRLKILDAWAMGKAVVSTSIGCEGLQARDGENILIRDSPEEFALAVEAVLRDADLRRRLAAGARRTAERVYDWEAIARTMLPQYLSLALPGPQDRPVPAPGLSPSHG